MQDTYIGKNEFKMSVSSKEIETSDTYDGAMLYDIWRNNGNVFAMPTYAALEVERNLVISKNKVRYIYNQEKEVQTDVGAGGRIDTLPAK